MGKQWALASAGAAALLVVAACGGSSTPQPKATAKVPRYTADPIGAEDEAVIDGDYGHCASFEPGGICPMHVYRTEDGTGGMLYAVWLTRQVPDGTGRGAVFFFDGTTLLTSTPALAPGTPSLHGPGLQWVSRVSVPGAAEFAVDYVVSSGPGLCTACTGDAGTATYVYAWDGEALTVQSGTPPTPPAVIGDGGETPSPTAAPSSTASPGSAASPRSTASAGPAPSGTP